MSLGRTDRAPLRNALIEISDLSSENGALYERARELFVRLKKVCEARGLPPPTWNSL
jgi:hypothetical protein